MKLSKFRIGFLLGYLVAVIRRADENDPLIQRLRAAEDKVRGLKERFAGLPKDHMLRQGADKVRKLVA